MIDRAWSQRFVEEEVLEIFNHRYGHVVDVRISEDIFPPFQHAQLDWLRSFGFLR